MADASNMTASAISGDDYSTGMGSKRVVVSISEESDKQGAHEEARNVCEAADGHLAMSKPALLAPKRRPASARQSTAAFARSC